MVSLLRQLRSGFHQRPGSFPASVALIGMRDLRDEFASASFNVNRATLRLSDFTEADVAALYGQHTADTSQVFEEAAVARAFEWTQGQPFLVNQLAHIATGELEPGRSRPITVAHVDEAKERLVLARTTHLDSLAQRLRDPRVARIAEG